ncbi:uncharacterized protein LAESUDRAFT_650651 [Laetiporus sulphureus 93-53]|uniref:Uncharacterized protein n=1 Tax=Laetiporus sulphureus 93-53 TaxID=1314785 RepID=A0A165EUJ0_9APHY|nr:uncharacterized protein LAESUDRAFT_650651 [Laetiporus sulphureus 93-53]KZT07790.1 hypothetical protein LAESUDRAFT_650651 [Laetiporus sulphureus 93-53]
MFTTLVSAALLSLAIRGARADFAINTPTFTECQPANISWSNTGAAPYSLIVVPANDPCGDEVADLGDFYGTSTSWKVALAAGEDVMLSVMDASGDEAWSGSVSHPIRAGSLTVLSPGKTDCSRDCSDFGSPFKHETSSQLRWSTDPEYRRLIVGE